MTPKVPRAAEQWTGVTAKRINGKQRRWLREYYGLTGFEAMGQHDLDAGLITFDELVRKNVDWFHDLYSEVCNLGTNWR